MGKQCWDLGNTTRTFAAVLPQRVRQNLSCGAPAARHPGIQSTDLAPRVVLCKRPQQHPAPLRHCLGLRVPAHGGQHRGVGLPGHPAVVRFDSPAGHLRGGEHVQQGEAPGAKGGRPARDRGGQALDQAFHHDLHANRGRRGEHLRERLARLRVALARVAFQRSQRAFHGVRGFAVVVFFNVRNRRVA